MKDKCLECGSEYVPTFSYQKFCSKRCNARYNYRRQKEERQKLKVARQKEKKRVVLEIPDSVFDYTYAADTYTHYADFNLGF